MVSWFVVSPRKKGAGGKSGRESNGVMTDKEAFEALGEEVTASELAAWDADSYFLVDVRDEMSYAYGHLPKAVNIPLEGLNEALPQFFGKKVVAYCKRGQLSARAVALLQAGGIEAYHLAGGYAAWLVETMEREQSAGQADTLCEEAENSIRKRFHKKLWTPFTRAITTYELVKEGDKIAVCISGGKDSMLMAKLFQELKRHDKFPFELVFLVMDPGYSKENRQVIENNARRLRIPVTVFESDIFESVYHIEKSPCYLCARMRRGHLYSKARELGCNKIALGHHYDDVIETILMGMLYGAQVQTMMPKLHSTNFQGMELIRPLYLVRERDIKAWRDANGLRFIQCACKFTDTCSSCQEDGQSNSKRLEIKRLIQKLKETNPFVENNIFKSVENVNLSAVIAYKKDGVRRHFLEDYDERQS